MSVEKTSFTVNVWGMPSYILSVYGISNDFNLKDKLTKESADKTSKQKKATTNKIKTFTKLIVSLQSLRQQNFYEISDKTNIFVGNEYYKTDLYNNSSSPKND